MRQCDALTARMARQRDSTSTANQMIYAQSSPELVVWFAAAGGFSVHTVIHVGQHLLGIPRREIRHGFASACAGVAMGVAAHWAFATYAERVSLAVAIGALAVLAAMFVGLGTLWLASLPRRVTDAQRVVDALQSKVRDAEVVERLNVIIGRLGVIIVVESLADGLHDESDGAAWRRWRASSDKPHADGIMFIRASEKLAITVEHGTEREVTEWLRPCLDRLLDD